MTGGHLFATSNQVSFRALITCGYAFLSGQVVFVHSTLLFMNFMILHTVVFFPF